MKIVYQYIFYNLYYVNNKTVSIVKVINNNFNVLLNNF